MDDQTFTTYVIRTKEDEDDYRYFPEPDLPPFVVTDEEIENIRRRMPPLQAEIKNNLLREHRLTEYDAAQLSEDIELATYFTAVAKDTGNPKAAANWVIGPVKNFLSENDLSTDGFALRPSAIAQLINLIDEGVISYGIAAQKVFPHLLHHPQTNIAEYIRTEGLRLQSGGEIDAFIDSSLTKHAQKITEYKKGKKGLLSLFVGEVMKLSKGKANAEEVTQKILEKLK